MGAPGGRGRTTLANAAEFRKVLRKGRAVRTPNLVIHTLRSHEDRPGRYGLVVSKKAGGAVARNRMRRRLREAIRLAGGVQRGADAVFVVRTGARPGVGELAEEIVHALAKSE